MQTYLPGKWKLVWAESPSAVVKDEPFSHFSFLFYFALVPVSLKSSVNLFLNHQNIRILGTFPRVVLSPIS